MEVCAAALAYSLLVRRAANGTRATDSATSAVDSATSAVDRGTIYFDGCFDMMHYGHANALRQARALGTKLVVGIHSDAQITENKGPPLIPYAERLAMLRATRWVDEVIENAPYTPTDEWMSKLFKEYGIDYIAHGTSCVCVRVRTPPRRSLRSPRSLTHSPYCVPLSCSLSSGHRR